MALSIKDLRKGFPTQQKPTTIKSFTIKEAPTLEPLTQVEGLQKYKADRFAEIEEANPQTGIDRIKETVKQKFDIDVDKRGKPFQVGEALKESKLTSDQKKELAKLLVEYETLKVEKSPAKQLETGFVKGFSPVSTTKLEESYLDDPTRYRESLNTVPATVGKVAGNMAKYASLYSLLGPAIAGAGGATAGGVGAATGTLAPTVTQQLGYTLGTGALGAITGELAKDVTIGAGLGGIEALQEGRDVAKTVAQNILMDIGFNIGGAALGKGFKTIKEAIDKAKASKTPQLIEEVAKSLNVSPQEASKQIDNQIDVYVNQYGVADTKPFEQLQLPSPKGTEYKTDTTAINLRQPKKPDVYVNQFGVADTKPFEQLQLDAPKNVSSDTSAVNLRLPKQEAKIEDSVVGSQRGQMDLVKTYVEDGKVKGTIEYSETPDEISIKFIEVNDKRKGIGTQLIKDLYDKYPNKKINWGSLTEEGAKLKDSLVDRTLNPKYLETQNRIKKLDAELKRLEELPIEQAREVDGDMWNAMSDEKDALERSLFTTDVYNEKFKGKQPSLPQDFTIRKPQYQPLAKDFARETVTPKITPQLKPKANLQDITIQKPTYPKMQPEFTKERPSVLQPGDVKPTLKADEVADPVLKKFRLDLFGATPEKPIKAVVEGKPVNVVGVKNNVATLSDGTNVAVKNVAMPKTKIEPTLKSEPIDTRSKVLVDMPKKAKSSLFDTYDRVYQEVVSKNIPFERIGGKSNVQASNLNRASGAVEYSVFENQIDMNGKDIGKSVVGIFSDVPQNKKAELFDYALNYHNIDRYAEGKPVFGDTIDSEVSKKIVKDLESQNPKLAAKQKEITKYFKNIMDEWSVKSGLVSRETADLLAKMYPNYVPTYRAKDLPKNMSFGGQNVAQVLKKAKGGDSDILPIDQMMVAMTDRTIKNARKNELMNTLAEMYQKGDNETVQRYVKDLKFSDEKEVIEDILDVGKLLDSEPVIKGDSYVVNFYRDGKPAQMTVNKTMYEALKNSTSDDSIRQVANFIKKYATDPMKATITGYNPLFTASNIMRDIPTALTFSSDPLNMSKQVPDAVKEMLTNGEKFRLFKAMGGTREGLIGSGGKFKVPSLKESKTVMDTVKKANPIAKVGEINNFVETLPRFTEFLNVLEKTGDPALAVYRSAELTTDFSRHGNLTKLVDSFVPYLNPSVQGIDKFFREMTKSPLKTIAKGATVITIPTMILDQVNKDNDAYNEMSPRERNLYFNIPFEDSKGNQKFVRIPKSRELGFVFSSLYEYAARLSRGQEVTGKEVTEAIKENFAPVDITSSTIFTPGIKAWNQIKNPDAYETNYFGSLIVPESQRNYSPGEQYDINSSGIAKAIGKQFNISPFVIDYLMNSYTGIIGQTLAPIGADKKSTIFTPFEKKFINDPVFKSNTITEFYEALDEATKSKNDFYRQNDLDSDQVAKYEKNKSGGTVELKKALELKKEASLLNSYSRELSDLRKEQKELKTSDDKNREELVRQIQIKMNELAKKALGELK